MSHPDFELDDLAQDRERIARILRSLLGSDGRIDDAVQEAYLKALRSGGQSPGRHSVGWFVQAAKHALFDRSRADRRRARRERAVSSTEALPSTAAIAAETEVRSRVQAAILSLDTIYRDVLLDRYFGDLSAADIARRDGSSVNTVKSRLIRAKAALRERLESDGLGGDVHWSVAAAPLLSTVREAPGLRGKAAMSSRVQGFGPWALGGGLVALVGLGVGSRSVPRQAALESNGPTRPRQESPTASAGRANEVAALSAPVPTKGRITEAPSSASAGSVDPQKGPETVLISATVAEVGGGPIQGVELRLTTLPQEPRAVSDEQGEVSLEVSVSAIEAHMPQAVFGRLKAKGYATLHRSIGQRTADGHFLGHIELDPGGALHGVVLDPEGEPLGGARLYWCHAHGDSEGGPAHHTATRPRRTASELCYTDSAGRYRVEGIPLGQASICAWANGTHYAVSAPREVRPGRSVEMPELQLRRAHGHNLIAGRVLDADGSPRIGEPVVLTSADGHSGLGETFTDGRGAFSFTTDVEGQRMVKAGRVGHDPLYAYDVVPGTTNLVLRPGELRLFTVRAQSSSGQALEGFWVSVELESGLNDHKSHGGSDDGAPVHLPMPPAAFKVNVHAPPLFTVWGLGPFDPDEEDLVVAATMPPFKGIKGLMRIDGKPAGDVPVKVYGIPRREPAHLRENGLYLRRPTPVLNSVTSATDGEIRLGMDVERTVKNGFAALEFYGAPKGQLPRRAGRLELDDSVLRASPQETFFEISLGAPSVLEGSVLAEEGADLRGWVVAVSDGRRTFHRSIGEAKRDYRFEGLGGGGWQVVAGPRESVLNEQSPYVKGAASVMEIPWTVTLTAGQTTRHDVDMRTSGR